MTTNFNLTGPQFVQYFGPLLEALRDLGDSARRAEAQDRVAENLCISDESRAVLIDSGASRFDNQIDWARLFLARGGYIDSSRRGVWTLTDKGRTAGLSHEDALEVYQMVNAQDTPTHRRTAGQKQPEEEIPPPEDTGEVTVEHSQVLLATLQELPPEGFERFCQRLLRESDFQDVTVTGRSGDGGIDGNGILQVNPLVSFKVLFQCKRYQGSVGSSQVRDFRGAMQGRADKGIFITTGSYTPDAKREAVRDGVPPIELVDGEKLVSMLENLELGLVPVRSFRVNQEFFEEYRR